MTERQRRRKADTNGARLLAWLPLALAVALGAAAWGTQAQKVRDLDRRVVRQEATEKLVQQIDRGQGVIGERTLGIQREQQQQRRLLERILNMLNGTRARPR